MPPASVPRVAAVPDGLLFLQLLGPVCEFFAARAATVADDDATTANNVFLTVASVVVGGFIRRDQRLGRNGLVPGQYRLWGCRRRLPGIVHLVVPQFWLSGEEAGGFLLLLLIRCRCTR